MKNLVILSSLVVLFLASSCNANNGAKTQTWAPKPGKPMKRGQNNRH